MRPWVRESNSFILSSVAVAHRAIQEIKEPFLSKIILFQVVECHSLRIVLPEKMIELFLGYESILRSLFPDPVIVMEIPKPTEQPKRTEGIHLAGDTYIGYDFSAPPVNVELGSLRGFTLLNKTDFLRVFCSFYKSVYTHLGFSDALKLIRIECKYAAYGLPSYLDIRDREEIKKFWYSEPSDLEILAAWDAAQPTYLDKNTLPFHFLYGDYLKNKGNSAYYPQVLDGAKNLFYAWQMFMVLTCFRFLTSCTFSSHFNPEFRFNEPKISNLLEAPDEVESVWNYYLSDPSFGFLFDGAISFDFNAYGDNEREFTNILETYGIKRLRELWSTRLGDRLPTGAAVGSENPRKTMSDIFDRNLDIHYKKDWRSFLDEDNYGFYWCVRYNISSKIRHKFRRSMIEHMRFVGGIEL